MSIKMASKERATTGVIYVSSLCSANVLEELRKESDDGYINFAIQKFNRMITRGMAESGADMETLTAVPTIKRQGFIRRWNKDAENGVAYNYLSYVDLPGLDHLLKISGAFFATLKRGIGRHRVKYAVCDVLNAGVTLGTLLAGKLCRMQVAGLVTDIPGMIAGQDEGLKERLANKVKRRYLKSFSGYILLTEAMNDIVNPRKRPYIIMEGLIDKEYVVSRHDSSAKRAKDIIYAGGLYRKYGLPELIEGFMMTGDPEARLHIYGKGDMTADMEEYQLQDSRIIYHGIKSNEEVMAHERRAWVLVNPRPTIEAYTKYSFPSKNMEYMSSGTPVLTTRLPGMPKEYYPYVSLIEEENAAGIAQKLDELLQMSESRIDAMGSKAMEFVLNKKEKKTQGARIISWLKSL